VILIDGKEVPGRDKAIPLPESPYPKNCEMLRISDMTTEFRVGQRVTITEETEVHVTPGEYVIELSENLDFGGFRYLFVRRVQ